MKLHLCYSVPNSRPASFLLPNCYHGLVSALDAEQVADGLRKTRHQEPTPAAVKQSVIALAKQRREGRT